jgi:hypothetical protein
MKKIELRRSTLAAGVLAAGFGLSPAVAIADWFSDIDVSFGGFVRQETAFRTTGLENPNNQGGNYFNDQTLPRTAFVPPALLPVLGGSDGLLQVLLPGTELGQLGSIALPIFSDTVRRGDEIASVDNDFNYLILRAEGELGITFSSNLRFIARARAIYDPRVYDEFDARNVEQFNNGIESGRNFDRRLYGGRPNYFEYIVAGGSKPVPLEWTGSDYQIYFPAMLLEYNSGDFALRLGNQQIAWGQSIFFRVFDLPNGLDLRRHSILDRALEEFSDKRVPMLSLRATYQATDNILLDGYVGKFQPTILGNPNTSYNIIPVQFTVQDSYKDGGYDDELVYGLRVKGDYGQWGFQAAASRRYGPEGVYRWTKSGVNKQLTGGLGSQVNLLYGLKQPVGSVGCPSYNATTCRRFEDSGEALANTPFEASPGGVYTADEWFRYAAEVRLDAVTGLNASITDFDGSEDVYATPVENAQQAYAQLNTFFIAANNSLRGHIVREYFQENVFALGLSYVNESDNDFLNQLIFNLEVQYTPERTFTNITLGREYIKQDEYIVSLVIDKWHRFFNEFPGTYIVFQALTKNRSDLVGRHLSGYGGKPFDELDPTATRATTGKNDNANYIVFGFLQPFPNKIWEIEFASLFDPEGGIFVQPGLRWNPGKGVTVEGFYNFIDGGLWGNPNNNLISTLDFAEEFTLRLTYQF